MRVPKKWLRSSFEEVPEDATEEIVSYHVRAYLLYLIGSTILPDSENQLDYPAYWLQFLDDLNPCNLNGVAWGAAVHCRLITGLERESYSYGPYWLFEMFFFERIPKIRKAFLEGQRAFDLVRDTPLHEYWMPRIKSVEGNKSKLDTCPKKELRSKLDAIRGSMTAEDIRLTPYDDYPSYSRQRIFFTQLGLFNFSDVNFHEPELGYKQLCIEDLKEGAPRLPLNTKSSKGTRDRKLCDYYEPHIKRWNEKRNSARMCIKGTESHFQLPPKPNNEEESEDEMEDYEDTGENYEMEDYEDTGEKMEFSDDGGAEKMELSDYEDTGEKTELSDDGGAERQNKEMESMDGGTEWAGGAMANEDANKEKELMDGGMEWAGGAMANEEDSEDNQIDSINNASAVLSKRSITVPPYMANEDANKEKELMDGGMEWAGGAMANEEDSEDNQIDSINNASAVLSKRSITVLPYMSVNIAGNRQKTLSKLPYSPSGKALPNKKRKPRKPK